MPAAMKIVIKHAIVIKGSITVAGSSCLVGEGVDRRGA